MSENFNNAILPEPLGGVNPFVNLILPDGAGQSEPGSFAIPSPLPQDQLPIQSFAHDNMFPGQIQEAIALSPPSGQQPPGPAPADPIVGATFVVNQEAVNFTTDGNNASADGTPWHLRSDVNSDADAKITNVWDKGVRGQNVVIGILDNGFEINDTDKNMPGHPDLLTNYRPDLSYDFDEEDAYPSRLLNRTIAYSGRRSTISDRSSLGSSFFMDVPLSGGVVHGLKVNLEIEHDAESGLDVLLFAPQKDPENDRQEVKVLSDVGDGEYSLDLTSDFQGIKANGSWKLKIKDKNTRDGKSGRVENWSLELETVNSHGTSVAGVAAASGDNGISGVAPLAQWAGLRMGADGTDDEEIARALSHKNDEIDIYNNSWGTGFFQEFPAAELALAEAVNNGRGGLGNIYVFSGGNAQRDELDNPHGNVNYHSLANSRHTIAVAAIDHEGKQALYSEPGAPLLVSAYSSGGGEEGDRAISTTGPYSDDGNDENDYNHAFGGTSASAPFVSGVIALMLDVNSQLTSRDVQHILVKTAQKNDPDDDDWSENGARYHVNHKYGFGAIDAEAAVDRARNWISVGEEISVGKQQLVDRHIPNYDPEDPQSLSSRITIDPEDDMTVEWVEVEFDGTHNYLGQLEIVLISPDGTESVLAENHGNFQYTEDDDSYEWTFTSARHWGELAVGDWTLVVKDKDERNPSDADFWNSWELNIYGTQPTVTISATDANASEDGDAGEFTVTRTGDTTQSLEVSYSTAGDAVAGTDYLDIGKIVIPAGSSSLTVSLDPIDDEEIEGDETVVLNLEAGTGYLLGEESSAQVSIADFTSPIPSIDETQWHLRSDVNPNADANITNVWTQDVLGRNVVIGILDNSFEINDPVKNLSGHPDLLTNYRSDLSYDFDEEDAYPSRLLSSTIAYSGSRRTIRNSRILDSSFIMDVPLSGGLVKELKFNLEIAHEAESGLDVFLLAPKEYSGQSDKDSPQAKVLNNVGDGEYSLDMSEDFQGLNAGGYWKLKIKDNNTQDGKSGSVENWSLELETVNSHGTSVAGVAAASGDNGISGVAPLAQWAGLRMGADGTDDEEIARALSHKNDEFDIYNNSWVTGFFQEFPAAELALAEAVNNGRGGLGNIYVFSGGNAQRDAFGNPHSNVNYNSLANSRHTIAVAAIDHEGKQALYSEPGAPLLVSAYSSSGREGDRAISTTGLYSDDGNDENDYNHAFGGTSASAPLVSGVIALMLEVNSQLTSRDVQHILVETAQKNDPSDEDWNENGAGYHVNHKYGFGAINAEAAVDLARNWTSVGEEISVSQGQDTDLLIPNYNPENPLTSTIIINPEDDMTIEWVEVEFDATHNYIGQLEIVLISPDGTESVLAENHGNGQYILDNDSYHWTFTSARHWGESAVGEWTLQVKDRDQRYPSDDNIWDSWKLNIYGT